MKKKKKKKKHKRKNPRVPPPPAPTAPPENPKALPPSGPPEVLPSGNSPAHGTFSRVRLGVGFIADCLTIAAGVVVLFLFFFSRDLPPSLEIDATPFTFLDEQDPYSAYFSVQNRSAYRLTDVSGQCVIRHALFSRPDDTQDTQQPWVTFKDNLTKKLQDEAISLAPGSRAAFPCESTVPIQFKPRGGASIELIVRYRYWRFRSGQTVFRFFGDRTDQGKWVWFPRGGTVGPQEFLEQEKSLGPAMTPAVARIRTSLALGPPQLTVTAPPTISSPSPTPTGHRTLMRAPSRP